MQPLKRDMQRGVQSSPRSGTWDWQWAQDVIVSAGLWKNVGQISAVFTGRAKKDGSLGDLANVSGVSLSSKALARYNVVHGQRESGKMSRRLRNISMLDLLQAAVMESAF